MKGRAIIWFCVLSWMALNVCAQGINQDSVQHRLVLATNDAEKLSIFLQTAKKIFNSDPLLAIEYAQRAGDLARKLDDDSLFANARHAQANALLHLGNYTQALDIYLSY